MNKSLVRNFSIIAHIDHGKSTLSDRIIEITHGLEKREMQDQILDSMDIERERGITIKLNAIQLHYHYDKDGNDYIFHLIDTPGHIDFTYEVSRSLAACEGALLVVDASQGIEAQTLSNVYLALENNLEIIPVINKIDLPTADIDVTKKEIEDLIGLDCSNAPCISAKTGLNIEQVIESIINYVSSPIGDDSGKLQVLIFDSYYDSYKGVICLIRIKNGTLKVGQHIKMMSSGKDFVVTELGIRTPKSINKNQLVSGEVGWVAASIKTAKDISVGDTITDFDNPADMPLKGYKKILPMVYCGIYPIDNSKFDDLKEAMAKISLSDSSLTYEYETSKALGFGIRCGFLGLLHMDVIRERIQREYGIDLILTAPSVKYKVLLTNGEEMMIDNPSKLPDRTYIKYIAEPFVKLSIITPEEYIGGIMDLCHNRRGEYIDLEYIDNIRRRLIYEIPLGEIIYNFFDNLKTISRGYATMDYEFTQYKKQNLLKIDILLNGTKVDALSMISHSDFARAKGMKLCEKLKEHIPRQQFEIPIQAAIGGKIIARENIKALYKNVLAKCYGGDVSRKKKLLEQQKEGKKKLKLIGNVSIPQDTFIKILSDE